MNRIALGVVLAAALPAAATPITSSVVYDQHISYSGSTNSTNYTAAGLFSFDGGVLSISLTNTSTGLSGWEADWLLTTVGFDLPTGLSITSAAGLSTTGAFVNYNDSSNPGTEWFWRNGSNNDGLAGYNGGVTAHPMPANQWNQFANGSHDAGPRGGIAAAGLSHNNQAYATGTVTFQLNLSGSLNQAQLDALAQGSAVEFGSDFAFRGTSVPIPSLPGALAGAAGLGLVAARRRR